MALCKKLRPGEYTMLLDGGAIRNLHTSTIKIVLLSPAEATAQKISEQIELINSTKGQHNDNFSK
jgi:hypothetical protein